MSFSGVPGGFQGNDALLAFATIQQGRLNDQMSDAMRLADMRSQMAGDLSDIKTHLEAANRHPEMFPDVDKELQAFMAKYGDEASLDEVTSAVGEIADNIHGECTRIATNFENATLEAAGDPDAPTPVLQEMKYDDKTIKGWMDNITERLDAAGTNDQLAMIGIKSKNDAINNSSGTISGIIESRNNTMSSIINNIA